MGRTGVDSTNCDKPAWRLLTWRKVKAVPQVVAGVCPRNVLSPKTCSVSTTLHVTIGNKVGWEGTVCVGGGRWR